MKRNKEEYAPDGLFEVQDNLAKLLSFLDTLQEKSEKPINEDSDEIIKRSVEAIQKGNGCGYIKPIEQPVCEGLDDETLRVEFKKIEHQCFEDGIFGWEKEKLIARHFYELGRQSKPKVSEDLEDEVDKRWKEWIAEDKDQVEGILTKSEFAFYARHFAQWQKEQMMKEAVECDVDGYGYLMMDGKRDILVAYPFDFEMPKKVRIVIVKED